MKLNERSLRNLAGVHPDLVKVIELAATKLNDSLGFVVIEGLRTRERQAQLVREDASDTMASRHLTGHAVDLAASIGGQIRWDWPLYDRVAVVVKAAAAELQISIEWGGNWKSRKDGPHFQLTHKDYPT